MEETKKIKALRTLGEKVNLIKQFALEQDIKVSEREILDMLKKQAEAEIRGMQHAESSIKKHLDVGVINAADLANKVISDLKKRTAELQQEQGQDEITLS